MSKPATKHQESEAASATAPLRHVEAPPVQPPAAPAPAQPAAAPNPTPAAAAPPRHNSPLALPRIILSHAADGSIGNRWYALIPKGTPFDDVTQDWFWANRAKDMKPGDEIRVVEDTWAYAGLLLVQQTRVVGPGAVPNRVSVVVQDFKEHTLPAAQANLDGMFTSYEGVYPKWCVMQRGNPVPVREGYDSQADAERERRNLAASRMEPRRPDGWQR